MLIRVDEKKCAAGASPIGARFDLRRLLYITGRQTHTNTLAVCAICLFAALLIAAFFATRCDFRMCYVQIVCYSLWIFMT